MTLRAGILIAVATGLVAGNLWYWWPDGVGSDRSSGRAPGIENFQLMEGIRLQLPPLPTQKDNRVARDLFRAKLKKSKVESKIGESIAEVIEASPPIPPEELNRRAARLKLGQVKFVGVVSHDSVKQAFLIRDKESFLAGVGDKIGDDIVLIKITFETAVLTDLATGASAEIILSGNQ